MLLKSRLDLERGSPREGMSPALEPSERSPGNTRLLTGKGALPRALLQTLSSSYLDAIVKATYT